MNPWTVDAREAISDVNQIDDGAIELNDKTQSFLEKSNCYFVIGTKGFGKSLLLLAKRKKLKKILIIPESELLDVPSIKIKNLSRETISLLEDKDAIVSIWSISIAVAVIKRLNLTEKIIESSSKSLLSLIEKDYVNTVSSVFETILVDTTRREFYEDLAGDYNRILLPIIRSNKKDIAIFIDNVDECFEGCGNVWYDAQNALMRSIYDLSRINNKTKVYASIRKEAFLKNTSEMLLQYRGSSAIIEYTREELKEIFIKNILKLPEEKLLDPRNKSINPVSSYIGCETLKHGVVDENEKMCDHIFRHTLRRPRDLMEIGSAIYICDVNDRDPNTKSGRECVKNIINASAGNIAKSYLAEVVPHLTISEADIVKMSLMINSNVLSKNTIKQLCAKFNGNTKCISLHCRNCTAKHIFCELYKIGLLGFVKEHDTDEGVFIQKFLPVGDKLFDAVGLLPHSPYYLIHPVLSEYIRISNNKFSSLKTKGNIIGYERIWSSRRGVGGGINKTTNEYIDNIDVLLNIVEFDLSKYIVVGSYYRFNDKAKISLIRFRDHVLSQLRCCDMTVPKRFNYLVSAPPGSGKTHLISEIHNSVVGSVSFVSIDLSRDSEDDVRRELNKIGNTGMPCLCMIDEIDGKSDCKWPYDLIYKKLDVNLNSAKFPTVFVLIGSSGGTIDGLIDSISDRYKAKDMIDRITKNSQFCLMVPALDFNDAICIYISNVIEASTKSGKRVLHIEKLAVFYAVISGISSPRQLKMLADDAVNRLSANSNLLTYDHHFEHGDKARYIFLDTYPEAFGSLSGYSILLS